jgi:hypothetical protein
MGKAPAVTLRGTEDPPLAHLAVPNIVMAAVTFLMLTFKAGRPR